MAEEARLEEALGRAASMATGARHVVALVGAGMSVESGIPPFRGPGGLWTRFGEPDMNGYQCFLADPKAWWEQRLKGPPGFRVEFQDAIARARPNPGHHALARLEEMGILKHIITQNVDNLHLEAGSKKVAEIHGNRKKLRCISCEKRYDRDKFPIDPEKLPPRCPDCRGIVKDDGVMFGEPIPMTTLQLCHGQTALCDCMLVLGTSGVVYPAAGFPIMAQERGASLVEVNPYETSLTRYCDVVLRGNTGELLPALVDKIAIMREDVSGSR